MMIAFAIREHSILKQREIDETQRKEIQESGSLNIEGFLYSIETIQTTHMNTHVFVFIFLGEELISNKFKF
jgi:hypothetical protein